MKTSTEIRSSAKYVGEEKAIELIARAGFDGWDFSMLCMVNYNWATGEGSLSRHELCGDNYLKKVRAMKQVGIDNGIVCNQSHAPYPTYCKTIRDTFERSLESTAEAGARICVVHPDNYKSAEENAELFFELLPTAKKYGVNIAIENMCTWYEDRHSFGPTACSDPSDFLAHLNILNDDNIVACLDVGHASLKGIGTNPSEMIYALGNKLQALHLHDNDLLGDRHQLPFTMSIDFDSIAKALADIGYGGYLTLESTCYTAKYNAENIFDALCDMHAAAKRISDMVESHK